MFGEMRTLADWALLMRTDVSAQHFAEEQLPAWARIASRVGEKDRVLAVSHGGIVDLPAIVIAARLGTTLHGSVVRLRRGCARHVREGRAGEDRGAARHMRWLSLSCSCCRWSRATRVSS